MINKFLYFVINVIVNLIKNLSIKKKLFDKIFFIVGLNFFKENNKYYSSIKSLEKTEYKVFSQNGEDGIIDYLINQLNLKVPNFFEIGVGDYRESNTRFIYQKYHSKGVIIDCLPNLKQKIKHHVNLWKGDLKVIEDMVTSEKIENILKKSLDFELDIFSIDIDGIDYWIIEKLPKNISKIFIAEYNSTFGTNLKLTVPYIEDFSRNEYHYSNLCYGMSLMALIDLMDKKNYYFVGTNIQKNNAFFVSKQYKKEDYFGNLEIEDFKKQSISNIRESRNKSGKLNFLSGGEKIAEIKDCEVIDLSNENKKIKIQDIINEI